MGMNWNVQTVAAGMLAAIGLYILFNPVSVTTLVAGVIPWLLIAAGSVYLLALLLRSRLRPLSMVLPGMVGVLLVYSGLSLKFGDPTRVGPIGLAFLFGLLLIGGGTAKLLLAAGVRRSRYFLILIGSAGLSIAMGLITLIAWSGVSAGFLGVVLGLELLADAAFLVALALRDRDKEEAREALGLDPPQQA
jgi:membrane protein HdeD